MMSGSFRIGIIGCGKIAPRHAQACLQSPGLELAVLVDPCASRAEELALRFGQNLPVRTAVRDALKDADGFVIATPNHLHAGIAVECLRAGKSVLIEKPLAASVADGEEICRAAEDSGAIAAVGYVTRFRQSVQLMHELLTSNYFGEVQRFAYQYGARGGWTPYTAYNLDRAAMGGGVLVTTGSHFLDRMIYWFGDPDEAWLEDDAFNGPEANAHAHVQYHRGRNGMVGAALFSRTLALKPGLVMETDAGLVLLEDEGDAAIRFRPVDQPRIEVTVRGLRSPDVENSPMATDSFQLQLEDFAAACQTGRPPCVTAREGLRVQELMERLYANRAPMPEDWYAPVMCGIGY